MATERMKLGIEAEEAVCRYLQVHHYRILDRNWRRPWGELDIVAWKDSAVHFIEVKASRQHAEGFAPYLRANGWKMHKVHRTAQTWLSAHRYGPETEWQLAVASVIMDPAGPTIEIIPA
jgi:putative endonuclease